MGKYRPKKQVKSNNLPKKQKKGTEILRLKQSLKEDGIEEEIDSRPKVIVDLDQIHKRIHAISTKDLAETGLFWSYDSKRLAFFATT